MLAQLPAIEAAKKIDTGEITSVELVTACLERIAQTDEKIGAWAYLDKDQALERAAKMDVAPPKGGTKRSAARCPGWGQGYLRHQIHAHRMGDDLPQGSPTRCQQRCPSTSLHEAGAIVLGKTSTTELAFAMAGPTRNPHNEKHTSGGSSAGSAAGVVAEHIPLAIGKPDQWLRHPTRFILRCLRLQTNAGHDLAPWLPANLPDPRSGRGDGPLAHRCGRAGRCAQGS